MQNEQKWPKWPKWSDPSKNFQNSRKIVKILAKSGKSLAKPLPWRWFTKENPPPGLPRENGQNWSFLTPPWAHRPWKVISRNCEWTFFSFCTFFSFLHFCKFFARFYNIKNIFAKKVKKIFPSELFYFFPLQVLRKKFHFSLFWILRTFFIFGNFCEFFFLFLPGFAILEFSARRQLFPSPGACKNSRKSKNGQNEI